MAQIEGLNRVLAELQLRESELAAQEERQRQAAERQADRQLEAIEGSGRNRALEQLRGLADQYSKRAEIANQAAPILAQLWDVEKRIRATEDEVFDLLRRSRRFSDTPQVGDWYKQLRSEVGLPRHFKTGLPMPRDENELAAATMIWAQFIGAVRPGFIQLGRVSVNMDVDI